MMLYTPSRIFYNTKIESFSRVRRLSWRCWGFTILAGIVGSLSSISLYAQGLAASTPAKEFV
jgi:hypothetical protein